MNILLDCTDKTYKTIDITPYEAVTIYNRIHEQCIYIATRFAKATREAFKDITGKYDNRIKINGKEYSCPSDYLYGMQFDTLEQIYDDTFECSYTYNGSCHCHPEYEKFMQKFPIELLDYADEALENKILELTTELRRQSGR